MNTYFMKLKGEEMQVGDIVIINGVAVHVGQVLQSDWYPREGYFSEFRDSSNVLRYWKQYIDGGDLFRVVSPVDAKSGLFYDMAGKKHMLDCYGMEVDDIFEKYGYSL